MSFDRLAGPAFAAYHAHSERGDFSAMVAFPLALGSDSGAAHVLEHMICLTPGGDGKTLLGLQRDYPDLYVNAITEVDYVCFHLTCTRQDSFTAGLAALLEATLARELDEAVFVSESCNIRTAADGTPALGGVVYHEMSQVYYSLRRQLASATTNQCFDGAARAYEPGGTPDNIRKLRFCDVQHLAARALIPTNAIVLTSGPQPPAYPVIRPRAAPGTGTPRRTESRFRTAHRHHYIPSDGSDRPVYRRYLIELGHVADAAAAELAWVVTTALPYFTPILSHVGEKRAAAYEPDLSGVTEFGLVSYFVLTYRQAPGGAGLDDLLRSVLPTHFAQLVGTLNFAFFRARKELAEREREALAYGRNIAPAFRQLHALIGATSAGPADPARTAQGADLAGIVAHWLRTRPLREACIEPTRFDLAAVRQRDARWLRRMAGAARYRPAGPAVVPAAPVEASDEIAALVPVANAPAAVATNGITYWHGLYNVMDLSPAQLLALPAALQQLEAAAADILPAPLETYLFAHAVPGGRSVLAFALKLKLLSSEAGNVDVAALVRRIVTAAQDTPAAVAGTHGQYELNDALTYCSTLASHAARTASAWSAPARAVAASVSPAGDLLPRLPQLPQCWFRIADGTSLQGELLERAYALDGWAAPAPAVAGQHAPPAPRLVLERPGQQGILVAKLALPRDGVAMHAALAICAEVLNRHHIRPALRDRIGAYGAGAGIDWALDEMFLFAYRCPALVEATALVMPAQLATHYASTDAAMFERARRSVLARFASPASPLNRLVTQLYDVVTHKSRKVDELNHALSNLTFADGIALAQQYLADAVPALLVMTGDPATVQALALAHGYVRVGEGAGR
jgi:predicted Zn-dependent peptidase